MSHEKKRGFIPQTEDELIYNTANEVKNITDLFQVTNTNREVYDISNHDRCRCWVCEELHEEIKSLQKAETRSRKDIRNIIREELTSFFKREFVR